MRVVTGRVTSPIDLAELEASTRHVGHAVTLPAACYTSPEFYAFEQAAVFDREWLCLGRVEQVPTPGDYFTVDVVGEPLLVVRNRAREIVVMSAVCRHRAMLVAEGAGHCDRVFLCPYHWWSYDLDGRFVSGPEMHRTPGFDRGAVALPRLAVEIWNGFVFASFAAAPEPLAPRLAGITGMLANYHADEMRTTPVESLDHLPFNWKVMMENALELYHNNRLHSRYLGPAQRGEYVPVEADDGAIVAPVRRQRADVGLNPTGKVLFPVIGTLTDEERHVTPFATIPPNLMLGWQSDLLFWFLLLPEGPEQVSLRWAYCLPPSSFDLVLFDELLEMTRQGVSKFNAQDLPVATAVQRGLRSRFAPRGSYSWEEEMLVQVNRWLLERYRRAAGSPQGAAATGPLARPAPVPVG